MSSNSLNDSDVMNLTRNTILMSITGAFIIIIFFAWVYYYSRRRQATGEAISNHVRGQKPGLDDAFLKTLGVIKFDRKMFKQGLQCAVCLSEVKEGEKTRVLPRCQHGFHMECVDMWFRSHSTCPMCRNPIVDQVEISLELQDSTAVLVEGDEADDHR